MSNISTLTIGSDPEFILQDKATGQVVSAEGLFGGTKDAAIPTPIGSDFLESSCALLEDGVCLEVNTNPMGLANPFDYFIYYGHFLSKLESRVIAPKGLKLYSGTEAEFDPKFLKTRGTAVIGCAPDLCAYSVGGHREAPDLLKMHNTRFAGGHIHIGIQPWPEELPKNVFVRFLDLILGLPINAHFNNKNRRKEFYGLAGLYRDKPYGVEYRSLPNTVFLEARTNSFSKFSGNVAPLAVTFLDYVRYINAGKSIDPLVSAYKDINWPAVQAYFNQSEIGGKYFQEAWEAFQRTASTVGIHVEKQDILPSHQSTSDEDLIRTFRKQFKPSTPTPVMQDVFDEAAVAVQIVVDQPAAAHDLDDFNEAA